MVNFIFLHHLNWIVIHNASWNCSFSLTSYTFVFHLWFLLQIKVCNVVILLGYSSSWLAWLMAFYNTLINSF